MKHQFFYIKTALIVLSMSLACHSFAQQKIGIFDGQSDVGLVKIKGSANYVQKTNEYEISGSGYNIWNNHDEFHFLWKKMKGNFILHTRGKFVGKGVEAHRKIGWMIRSSLDTSAPHVSAAVHGDGLTSLQFRKKPGGKTEEIRMTDTAPDVIQLERRGNLFIMSVAHFGEAFKTVETSEIDLGDEVYAGLFIGSHNAGVLEKAIFDNVRITVPAKENFVAYKEYIGSDLELLDVKTGKREIIFESPESIQAPNWSKNGKYLLYNSKGLMYTLDLAGRQPKQLNTGSVQNNNNDHVISFDGKMLGLSSSSPDKKYSSVVYTVPIGGGEPKQITPIGLSYLHGWSPDGKFLVFTGQRNNEFDIYKVPAAGGEEVRLTTAQGLDDGPEYSPDGQYIYFNSNRTGTMQIFRMKADGSNQEQLTSDEFNNWFPHVSPDGKWIVFLSFMKDVPSGDHPFYKHVYLRLMPVTGGDAKVVAYIYGGQGTINTPSWAPDSKRLAFISNTDKSQK
jgi:TolB protein